MKVLSILSEMSDDEVLQVPFIQNRDILKDLNMADKSPF